ncbi:HNH endonuclease [Thiomicrospira microaerophila]|uniref:HNH endonuclease n=1 Tax=Thiomicrospira microaerophila TaxID=406020 RepID=UPI000697EF69|nr:HNH endonuclease [Thiomicrospira microaerophila]
MKIKVSFDALFNCLNEMGAPMAPFDSKIKVDKTILEIQALADIGININPEDIVVQNRLLTYKGHQIVVYIPDHSYKGVSQVLNNPALGNKYHFADCTTIREMRAKGRYEKRYRAIYNPKGLFSIVDKDYPDGEDATLQPCQNCLKHINYEGFLKAPSSQKQTIREAFSLNDFFSAYSTLFEKLPDLTHLRGGYADNWASISKQYRQSKNNTCEVCGVNLSEHRHMLHTHHINGNKQDNSTANLMALCIDCHRKQPDHDHVLITHDEMRLIMGLRRQQDLLGAHSWDDVFKLADKALYGLLYLYKANHNARPQVGYPIVDGRGKMVAELELAWPEQKKGVAIRAEDIHQAQKCGWNVTPFDEAMERLG